MTFGFLNLAVTVAVMVCVTVLAVRVVAIRRGERGGWLIAGICIAVLCNQILSRQEFAPFEPASERFDTGAWAPLLNLIRNTAPGFFMIQTHALFVDGERFPRWLVAAFALQLVLELFAFVLPVHGVLSAAPAALELMFGGLALYWTLAQWKGDLVEIRRRARAVVFVLVAVNIIAPSLLLRLVVLPGAWSFYVHMLLSAFTLLVAASLLVLDGETERRVLGTPELEPPAALPALAAPPLVDQDDVTLRTLQSLIDLERVHLEPDLKLSDLARRVQVPEYRLRRVIHVRLGHRNFNAYLHSLRIAEACRRLRDPEARRTPILTIALSVGYGSINSFNRGFRAAMGCSPSDYRSGVETSKTAPETVIPHQVLQSAEA